MVDRKENRHNNDKFIAMTTEPVQRLILKLALPTVISMLVTSLYSLTDTYFVGRISTQATAAVGVTFAVMSVIQAIGFFFGHGSGNFISRRLGARDTAAAQQMSTTGFVYAFLFGILITAVGLLSLERFSILLGSTPTILPYTKAYLGIILLGAPFFTSSLVLNNQMRFQGNAMYAMVGIVSGAVLNVILAPLFIFVFRLGISGAAIATVISQVFSFCLLLVMDYRSGGIHIQLNKFVPSWAFVGEIIRGGTPSLCRQGLACLATLLLNVTAGAYGDAAIAGMSIVTRVCFFIYAFLIGLGQGFQPVCGFNYGAHLFERVRQGFNFSVGAGFVLLTVICSVAIFFAPEIVGTFRHDPEVIAIGTVALRYQLAILPFSSFNTVSNMMLQTIRMSVRASLLASARQGLFFIPLILILPRIAGLRGVEVCQSIADVLTFALTIPLTLPVLRSMKTSAKVHK